MGTRGDISPLCMRISSWYLPSERVGNDDNSSTPARKRPVYDQDPPVTPKKVRKLYDDQTSSLSSPQQRKSTTTPSSSTPRRKRHAIEPFEIALYTSALLASFQPPHQVRPSDLYPCGIKLNSPDLLRLRPFLQAILKRANEERSRLGLPLWEDGKKLSDLWNKTLRPAIYDLSR